MGHSMTYKILADKIGDRNFRTGEIYMTPADLVFTHEVGTTGTMRVLDKIGVTELYPVEMVIISDHFVPAATLNHAVNQKKTREFAKKYGVKNYLEIGRAGIGHQVLLEKGFIRPGEIVIATDAHATTYGALGCLGIGVGVTDMAILLSSGQYWLRYPKVMGIRLEGKLRPGVSAKDVALKLLGELGTDNLIYWMLEFYGPGVSTLSIDSRACLCNMMSEGGIKSCLVAPDGLAIEYVKARTDKEFTPFVPDEDACYDKQLILDLGEVEPMLAIPDTPTNCVPKSEASGVKVDQAFIGSCTNGRIEDLRIAAAVLKGNKVHPDVRLIVSPATHEIWQQALDEGLLTIFNECGAVITNPTCGACIGAHALLAPGEVCIATSNRNFKGRMGSVDAKIYLASPETVAYAAIAGEI